jgi:endonuclease/exonuclease/phosphatase family metal-dependent hydrolase
VALSLGACGESHERLRNFGELYKVCVPTDGPVPGPFEYRKPPAMRRFIPAALALLLGASLTLTSATVTAAAVSTVDAFAPAPQGHVNVPVRDPFVLASFNVLGYAHTPPGSGYQDGETRMRRAVKALRSYNVDVVGFQEFEPRQKAAFLDAVNNSWGVFSGSNITRDSIAWNESKFEFVSGETIMIPYFYGELKPMPVVLLRALSTGQEMYFANFHLPASSPARGDMERARDRGTHKQIELAHQLRELNAPVFITGDMNELEEYFCKMTRNGDMHASNGGSNIDGVCHPPRLPNRTRIDWIMGSKGAEFSGYVADESMRSRKISDHALIIARVH